jgi:hypothetical protein
MKLITDAATDAANPPPVRPFWEDEEFIGAFHPPKPPRKPRLKTILDQAKKAGAASVTHDGATYTFGQPTLMDDGGKVLTAHEELERWRRKKNAR